MAINILNVAVSNEVAVYGDVLEPDCPTQPPGPTLQDPRLHLITLNTMCRYIIWYK